jgi:hypothetical protein
MTLTSFSKTVRSIGLMTMLFVPIATVPQQPVQSQTVAQDKNGVCTVLSDGTFYQEFGGIKFSPKQKVAYRKIEAKINKRYKVISDNQKLVVLPGASLAIYFKPGIGDRKATEISDVSLKLTLDKVSDAEQVKVLTKKYGRYANFFLAQSIIYTPTQIADGRQIGRDFEAQTMTILTPEQQNIYKVNLALQKRIQACSVPEQPFDRIISPLPY